MTQKALNAGGSRSLRTPEAYLALACVVVCGVLGGLGAFTFGYGDGAAYLKDDPQSCANCHVMKPQARWP